MNERDARDALLVRAFETPLTAPWTDADRLRVSEEARRHCGENAAADALVAQRARLAATRLAERDPAIVAARAATTAPAWLGGLVVVLALVAGVSVDHLGATQRINILAPPLLALIAWNTIVYLALALKALRAPRQHPIAAWLAGVFWQRVGTPQSPALARFMGDWARLGAPLHQARVATVLHAAAAALALGALASLYLRGLAFEYRAGWDSTFLGVAAVHRLLSVVLGPAAWLSGLPLPGSEELARLRFANGPGENAARWIHLYAITLAALIVLPRLSLATGAALRARALAKEFPLPWHEPYLRRLAQTASGQTSAVAVWPYSYHASVEALNGLARVVHRILGPAITAHFAPVVPVGGEDDLASVPWPAPVSGSAMPAIALFASTATPERETHGAFIDALTARCGATPWVLVDESTFRRHFTGPDAAQRLQERRAAWQALLQGHGATAVFVDLLEPEYAGAGRSA